MIREKVIVTKGAGTDPTCQAERSREPVRAAAAVPRPTGRAPPRLKGVREATCAEIVLETVQRSAAFRRVQRPSRHGHSEQNRELNPN